MNGETGDVFVRRYVGWLSRRSLPILVASAVLFGLALLAARRLELRSDFTELLPRNDPELLRLQEIGNRIGGNSNLIIAVEGPDPAANERFAEALVSRLKPLVGSELRAIDHRADEAKAFYEHNRALFADLRDLRRMDDDFKKLVASKKNPAFVTFADSDLGEEKDDPARDLEQLRKTLEKRHSNGRFSRGYFESEDGHLLAIVTWTRSTGTGDRSGFAIRDRVARVIDETQPRRFGNVTARITGDVASAIEEHDALKSDIEWVSVVCTVLVVLVIVLYYRTAFSLLYIFLPTLLGVALAFGFAAVTIGYLNTNTAFLGSIILGNGINFGIVMLARYREERTRDEESTTEGALTVALARTARPTLVAALCAGIAYASLALTRFRGFRQFGEIGGLGMVLCWLATYSFGPALICAWEKIWRRSTLPRPLPVVGLTRAAAWFLRRQRSVVAVVAVVTVLAAIALVPLARSPFEYDFSKLRNQHSRKKGAGDLYVRVGRIFPQDLAPIGIALLPSAADAGPYRRALLEADCADGLRRAHDPRAAAPAGLAEACARRVAAGEPTGGLLSAVSTVDDYVPKDQAAKLAIIADIRARLADPSFDLLSPENQKKVRSWLPPANLRAIGYGDLPDTLTRRFREKDGTVGRVALIYPVRVWANWDGHNLIRMSDLLDEVRLPNGDVVRAAGHSSLFAAMLRSIGADGPKATLAAFVGVVLMVALLFRRLRNVLLVVASLMIGIVWMGGAGAVLGLKLNFLNFVVVPVTLGIGVDYAVNVFARLEAEHPENHSRALAETGSAVALCSSTTIIGYSSLLIASNGALRSFGKLADLGEIACLLSALLLVPVMARATGKPRGPAISSNE